MQTELQDTSVAEALIVVKNSASRRGGSSDSEGHKPNRQKPLFLRLPPAYHEALNSLARKGRRTLTAEAMIALEEYFEKNGVQIPPSA